MICRVFDFISRDRTIWTQAYDPRVLFGGWQGSGEPRRGIKVVGQGSRTVFTIWIMNALRLFEEAEALASRALTMGGALLQVNACVRLFGIGI